MTPVDIIQRAEFDPRVKTYWLLSGALLLLITIVAIPLILPWFLIGFVFTQRYLDRMECLLTRKALKVKKGLFVRVEKTLPLEKITDLGMVQGPIMRWLGIERLTVETAGQSGAGALVSLTGVVRAQDFREAVLKQRDRVSERLERDEADPASPSADSQTLTEVRDSLLRIEKLLETRSRTPG